MRRWGCLPWWRCADRRPVRLQSGVTGARSLRRLLLAWARDEQGGFVRRTLLQRWIGVLQQLLELRLEPMTRQRCVRQRSGHVVVVARIATVSRIAHAIETFAFVVRNIGARTIRLARRLDPDVGIDARGRRRTRTLANASATRIAPVALWMRRSMREASMRAL